MKSNEQQDVSSQNLTLVVIFYVFVGGLLYYIFFVGCGACLSEEDNKFANSLLNELKEKGDTVLVNEIHPGNWDSVCATGYGFNANLLKFALNQDRARVINGSRHYIYDADDDSAVVFRHNSNDLEVFRMTPNILSYSPESGKTPCVDRKDAEFVLRQRLPGNIAVTLRKTER